MDSHINMKVIERWLLDLFVNLHQKLIWRLIEHLTYQSGKKNVNDESE